MVCGLYTLGPLVIGLIIAESVFAETIYLGPYGQTASGPPGVQTRTELLEFTRDSAGATAVLHHSQLQSGWKAKVSVECDTWTVNFHPGRVYDFSVRVTSEGPVIFLPDKASYILDRPEQYKAAYESALRQVVDNYELGNAHRTFHAHLNLFGFIAGHLTAKTCLVD